MQALVIDDSRTMRRVLSRLLTGLGFDVAEAADGQHALEQMRAGPLPRLCLVDWNMPVMDGYTFVHRVREESRWSDVRLLMVTTETSPNHVVRAFAAGADDYMTKPFTPEGLEQKLELLGLAREELPV